MRNVYKPIIRASNANNDHASTLNTSYDYFLLSKIREELNSAERVLDIGCGSGALTRYLNSKSINSIGIDVRDYGWSNIENNVKSMKIMQGDATSLPISDNSIDVAILWASLEHIGAQKTGR
jgi:ubiquinone/menaquinone biosynthesis C-methylase UbiE